MSIKKLLNKNASFRNFYFSLKQRWYNRKNRTRGRNNIIQNDGRFFKVSKRIFGNNNTIITEEYTNLLNVEFYILGNNNTIKIGRGSTLNDSKFWIEGDNCVVTIGERVEVMGASFAATESNQSIEIGDDSLLSVDVDIRTSDSHSIIDLESNKRINQPQSIKIGSHVWIGINVCILKGTTIGNHTIIGARSLITKEIPSNVVAAGNPAKVIKTNVSWSKNRIE